MVRLLSALFISSVAALIGSAAPVPDPLDAPVDNSVAAAPVEVALAPPPKPSKPKPPTVEQALDKGVLMVVSIPNQRIYVFKDGALWDSATVSTGKRGHSTPVGVFPILQKSVAHRSTLYNDAPMPYMQRLTWGGVALHGGNITRQRASHGCIRLPHAFARKLYAITSFRSTAVLVTQSRAASPETALALASGYQAPAALKAPKIELAAAPAPAAVPAAVPIRAATPAAVSGPVQTIQLAAAPSAQNAALLWTQLVARQPQLGRLSHQIIPATVGPLKVFRLRASGTQAAAICRNLPGAGVPCFRVVA